MKRSAFIKRSGLNNLSYLITSFVVFNGAILAQNFQTDPRKSAEVTICSQNLENFGLQKETLAIKPELGAIGYQKKLTGLIERFKVAKCDVIALQEVLGKTEAEAKSALDFLASELQKHVKRPFEARVSPVGDGRIRTGFIVALDRVSIENLVSFGRLELPKLDPQEKPTIFERVPLEIQLSVRGQEGSEDKILTLLNFHLKSKSGAAGDAAALEFETVRMQMAEALRKIIELRHSQALEDEENILVLLGDRNSDSLSASAKILDGSLALMDFQQEGACRLSKKGLPLCQTEKRRAQKLFSPLTLDKHTSGIAGTYFYKEEGVWIDDILLTPAGLSLARVSVYDLEDYDTGTISNPKVASDHSLVFVRLNW
jgi:endonuclease/exonuclease/phosphatase family metal-dependent hydrolase